MYIEPDITNTRQFTHEEIDRENYDPDDFYLSHDMGGSVLYRYDHCNEYTDAERIRIQEAIENGDLDFGEKLIQTIQRVGAHGITVYKTKEKMVDPNKYMCGKHTWHIRYYFRNVRYDTVGCYNHNRFHQILLG